MKKTIYIFFIFTVIILCKDSVLAQNNNVALDSNYINRVQFNFEKAYNEITNMLDGKQPLSFKRAVFLVENAYFNDSLNYGLYLDIISQYKTLTLEYNKYNKLIDYNFIDSINENVNASIFKVFTDTIKDVKSKTISAPFQYNFNDAVGNIAHANTFVSMLLFTKKGNCRSLPYLYKILTEELGTKSYLALAPMHIYIKQRNKKVGWYNVELTSAQYPSDFYLVSTGYISQQNIVSGLYMDTLSLRESVSICLIDLCKAYTSKLGANATINFQLQCANKALSIKSNYIDALLIKQRLHKSLWLKHQKENDIELLNQNKIAYNEINKKLIQLDYRDVPEETFQKWYLGYQKNKSSFNNNKINTTFKLINTK